MARRIATEASWALWLFILGVAVLGGLTPLRTSFAEAPPSPPARFVGAVMLDGSAPRTGTTVEARVGGAVCGTANTTRRGQEARYEIDTTCGSDGDVVTFYVGGHQADEAAIWRNGRLNTVDLSAHTVSVFWTLVTWGGRDGAPAAGLRQFVAPGWHLTAMYHWDESTQRWEADFPGASPRQGGRDFDTLQAGQAYWIASAPG